MYDFINSVIYRFHRTHDKTDKTEHAKMQLNT